MCLPEMNDSVFFFFSFFLKIFVNRLGQKKKNTQLKTRLEKQKPTTDNKKQNKTKTETSFKHK